MDPFPPTEPPFLRSFDFLRCTFTFNYNRLRWQSLLTPYIHLPRLHSLCICISLWIPSIPNPHTFTLAIRSLGLLHEPQHTNCTPPSCRQQQQLVCDLTDSED